MSSFIEVLNSIQTHYESSARAAEDLARGILAAESTEDIMTVIGAVGSAIPDDREHNLVIVTAYALVAKGSARPGT